MKFKLTSLFLVFASIAGAQTVSSPDGRLTVEVNATNGQANYTVKLAEKTFIEKSALGLNTSFGDFTKDVALRGVSEVKNVNDRYTLRQSKKSEINYEANEVTCSFNDKDGRHAFDVIFRVDNNNVAFRYRLLPKRDTRSCLIHNEATSFVIPEGSTTFLCPQMLPPLLLLQDTKYLLQITHVPYLP